MQVKKLSNVNIITADSKRIDVNIDASVAEYIRSVRDNHSNKHITLGTVFYEMLGVVGEIELSDNSAKYNSRVDAELEDRGVDVSVIDSLQRDSQDLDSSSTDRVKMFLPASVVSDLPYFKSDCVEDVVRAYNKCVWNDRAELIGFKENLLDYLNDHSAIDPQYEHIISNSEVRDIMNQNTVWHAGLSSREIGSKIQEKTKATPASRVPVIEVALERELQHKKELLESDSASMYIADRMIRDNINSASEWVNEYMDVSDLTAERYVDRVDEFWDDRDWIAEYLDDHIDVLLEDTARSLASDDGSTHTEYLNASNAVHYKLVQQLPLNDPVDVDVDGDTVTLEVKDAVGDGFKLVVSQ